MLYPYENRTQPLHMYMNVRSLWRITGFGHCSSCYLKWDQFLSQFKLRNILNLRADYIKWQNSHPHNSEELKQFQAESKYNTLNPNTSLLPANYIATDGGMQFTEHLCIAKFLDNVGGATFKSYTCCDWTKAKKTHWWELFYDFKQTQSIEFHSAIKCIKAQWKVKWKPSFILGIRETIVSFRTNSISSV